MSDDASASSGRVLLLPPTPRDGEATHQVLVRAGVDCHVCASVDSLCAELTRGAAAIVIPEESVLGDRTELLARCVGRQPVWSDLPIIILSTAGTESSAIERAVTTLGNVSVIERPMRISTLLSVVRAALRARQRQYEVRDALETRRRDAERLARDAMLLSQVQDAVIVTDTAGIVTFWNQGATRLFGWTADERLGHPLEDRLPEAERPAVNEWLRRIVAEDAEFDGEWLDRRKDGSEVWIQATARLIRDNDGRPLGVMGISRDVTERKLIEAALRQSEARFRQIANAMPQIVWAASAGGVVDYYNKRWYAYINLPKPDAGEKANWELYVHPGDIERVAETWRTSVLAGTAYSSEFRLRGGDGRYRWFLVRAEPVRDESGVVQRWYGTCTDIEERKRAERQDQFLVRLDDAVRSLVDPEEVTATFARLLGKHLEVDRCAYAEVEPDQDTFNLTGDYTRGVPSIVGRYRLADFGQEVLELMRADQPFVVDNVDAHVPAIHDLSAYRATMIKAVICVPLHKQGRFVAAMAVHQASPRKWLPEEVALVQRVAARCWESIERARVTRERERLLESEQAARTEAERAGRMKDEFLATLSHELRTPLNAILGWSQIMRASDDPADVAQGLEVIERNARAQSQIIEDLLDMSRIISGKVRLDVQRLDLPAILQSAVETSRPTADAKGVRLQSIIDPLPDAVVSGDANRLQQVMWNLLTNAIKFTPRGGRVQVVLARVDSHLEISVSDTGEGIKPEFLPYVFDRFRQADASTTRRHGGLGLGLSIVRQLVELHGGAVRVHSDGVGQGTTFVVTLPLTAVHSTSDAEHRHPRRTPAIRGMADPCVDVAGVRVLVVDDEPDARGLVQRLLQECNADVVTAASVPEALERLKEREFDVLVSDIGMPGMDGYELIRRVRSLAKEHNGAVPAIALTAYARTEDRIRAIAAGFQMHLSKPVEPAELLTMIASAAGRTSHASG